MSLQQQLYKKMSGEYGDILKQLKNKPPDEIIECSYEKVIKEDLLLCAEDGDIFADGDTGAEVLLSLDNPLDELYQAWLDSDYSYMDLLRDCIGDTVKKIYQVSHAHF